MNIREIHIYGFGQLSDVIIQDVNKFQVFYGENEAGKSTIMGFIHAILFGFPTRLQTSELRYEPKTDTKYGGKLIIHHEEFGLTTIERVKGKAAGDVRVVLENGTSGGEELLKQLLKNVDKGLFQAIFSFNIHGIQNINQMKGEELGRFLFSTGTLGTERLAKTETELQRELENRFKPNGKKPMLNEKLNTLHELNLELKKAAAKNQQYEKLMKEKESVEKEINHITRSIEKNQNQIEKLKEWKKIHPLVQEEKWIKEEISQIGNFTFPVRGIERLEKLNQLIYPYNAQFSSLVERTEGLKIEVASIQPDKNLLEEEHEILSGIEQVPIYEQLNQARLQGESKLLEVEEKIKMINEKLHLSLKEEEVLAINTNIYMKNQVEQVFRKRQRLIEEKEDLEKIFHEEKNSLEIVEEKVKIAENQLISEKERANLENFLNEAQNKRLTEKLQQQKRIQLLPLEAIFIILALYGMFTEQWILFSISLIGCLTIGYILLKNVQSYTQTTKLKLDKFKKFTIEELREQLNQDTIKREQLQLLKLKLEQQNLQYEQVILKFEIWEKETAANKKEILTLGRELKIPEYLAHDYLLEAFQLLEEYKTAVREKQQLLARLEKIRSQQIKIKDKLFYFSNRYLLKNNDELSRTAYLLRLKLKEEQEKYIKYQEKQAKIEDLNSEVQQISLELEHLKLEKSKLLREANAESEEMFYQLGEQEAKKNGQVQRLSDIQKHLQSSTLREKDRDHYLQFSVVNIDEHLDQLLNETDSLKNRLLQLQEEYAAAKYEIQLLEEGGLYSELLHQYKQKKFELEEAAKEWAVFALAQEVLSQTIEKYKTVHLPRMLAKAEEYLFFLTKGNYQRILLQSTGTGFLIERNDHILFEANELSQAAAEQVYVALRLALATTLYEKYHLPIIIDDSFVNFDAGRTKRVMELLKTLKQNQILFFTCHTHLLQYFEKEKVLYLHNGAVEVIS
nr:AAA family ATPase [Neobacillus sp. Marseille-Q6967]